MWYKGGLDCLWVTCRIVIVHKLRKHGLHSCANALDIIISKNCVRVNYNRIMTVSQIFNTDSTYNYYRVKLVSRGSLERNCVEEL